MERSKQTSINFFNRFGWVVTEIPEADGKRADLDVRDGNTQYIVEVKEKLDTESQVEWSDLNDGDTTIRVGREPHAPWNRLDGLLKHGGKQLSETPGKANAFRLLWFQAEGMNADMLCRRVVATFYGIAVVTPIGCADSRGPAQCMYFYYSTAFRMPRVNGLIVVQDQLLHLWVNEFSPNLADFRRSSLVRQLGDAITDPSGFDQNEGIIVLRSDVPRKNKEAVLAELERTTGVRYTTVDMNHYSFDVNLPLRDG